MLFSSTVVVIDHQSIRRGQGFAGTNMGRCSEADIQCSATEYQHTLDLIGTDQPVGTYFPPLSKLITMSRNTGDGIIETKSNGK